MQQIERGTSILDFVKLPREKIGLCGGVMPGAPLDPQILRIVERFRYEIGLLRQARRKLSTNTAKGNVTLMKVIIKNQLKSICNSTFKDSYSHSIHTCCPMISGNVYDIPPTWLPFPFDALLIPSLAEARSPRMAPP